MILYLDTTVREESRTKRIADHLVNKLGDEVLYMNLAEEEIPDLDGEMLKKRGKWCSEGDFDDPYFYYAKSLAAADTVVIAAPFWDYSFPASLKKFIEAACVTGITFTYEDGRPVGLCKGKKLYYVCTAGGPVFRPEVGFGYVEAVAQGLWGIQDCENITIEGLDAEGVDVEAMVKEACSRIDAM